MKKLRKRAGSLLLTLLMVLSSFAPFTPQVAYAVDAGSNDNAAGGEKKAATYNMHGWGAMVTLVTLDNPYNDKENELNKLAEDYEKGDKTSVAITRATEEKYLKTFPDFWLKSDVAGKSALIFIGSHDKYNEWNSGGMPTNKFVTKDGVAVKISKSYVVDRTAASPSSITINVIADVIRADEALKEKFFNGELTWTKVKSLANDNKSKLEASKEAFLSAFRSTGNTSTLLNKLLKDNPQHEQVISEDNALQYLDVLITVNSLTGGKCGDVVKAYLEGLNQDSANQFALVSIASVASNSDDTWLWYTIPSWYAQFVPASSIPLKMTGTSIDDFFKKYESTVTSTTFSGNAASLKKHRAWGWWHKQVSGYTAPKLSKWATTFRPTNKNGQMTVNLTSS